MASWEEKYNELQKENQQLRQELEAKNANDMKTQESMNEHSEQFWKHIYDSMNRNPEYVKGLVKKKILSIHDTNFEDWTLLMVAAKYGSYNVAQFCINAGVDIDYREHHAKWGHRNAIEIARSYANYHIEQLLLFSKMNADAGNEVRDTGSLINRQNGINHNIIRELSLIGAQSKNLFEQTVMEVMINILNKKVSFSDDLLNLCWKISGDGKDPLQSELWKAIKATCSSVIGAGSKRDWYWLREFIMTSTIWYRKVKLPSKNNAKSAADSDEKSEDKKDETQYLYYLLLDIVNVVGDEGLKKLKSDLQAMANKNTDDWNKLVKWNKIRDEAEMLKDIRQDTIPNGVLSQFTEAQLAESSGATFNSPKFYDHNQYLSQLVLLAHIVDDNFHESIQNMFNVDRVTHYGNINKIVSKDDIKTESEGDGKVLYKRGPVKLFSRAKSKAQSDYVDMPYPNSACVLDFNRCALVFNDISTLLKALDLFVGKVKHYESGNICGIVRDKNGFIEYVKQTQYADIKLNVLIKGATNNLIGEVQFLLTTMMDFKAGAHKLYKIQRLEEGMEKSVKQILPLLVDRDKQLYMAGARGSISELCRVMVIDNRPFSGARDSILQFDEYNQNILHSICQNGRTDIFLYLKRVLPEDLLANCLLSPSIYDMKALELAVRYNHADIAMAALKTKVVQENYQSNDELFRLMYVLFPYDQCLPLVDFIMDLFKISSAGLAKICVYKCKSPIPGKFKPLSHAFHRCNVLTRISRYGTLGSMKKLAALVGDKAFVDLLFTNDTWNQNAFEMTVFMRKQSLVEYLFSFAAVKAKYTKAKNDNLLFRLMYFMFVVSPDIDIYEYILSELKMPKKKLESAALCKYPSEHDGYGLDSPFRSGAKDKYYKWDEYTIVGKLVENGRFDELKKVFSLIGTKSFANDSAQLFGVVQGLNVKWNEAMAKYVIKELKITETKLKQVTAYQNIDVSKVLKIIQKK